MDDPIMRGTIVNKFNLFVLASVFSASVAFAGRDKPVVPRPATDFGAVATVTEKSQAYPSMQRLYNSMATHKDFHFKSLKPVGNNEAFNEMASGDLTQGLLTVPDGVSEKIQALLSWGYKTIKIGEWRGQNVYYVTNHKYIKDNEDILKWLVTDDGQKAVADAGFTPIPFKDRKNS